MSSTHLAFTDSGHCSRESGVITNSRDPGLTTRLFHVTTILTTWNLPDSVAIDECVQ